MRRNRLNVVTLLTLAMLVVPAVAAAQEAGGWRASSSNDRYGATGGAQVADQRAAAGGDIAPIGSNVGSYSPAPAAPSNALTPIATGPQRAVVAAGSTALPQNAGQISKTYDIRPYTLRANVPGRPEQLIVDWILRETGYEAWHSEPVGLLTATRETLWVHHTPEMHGVVANIVDRFVNTQTDTTAFTLHILTVESPNWRAKALPLMTPIPVQSPGVQGWLLAKEDAALMLSELMRRTDYREYSPAGQLIGNGQSVVISTMRPRSYVKGIVPTAQTWPGYQPEMGQLEEGFALEFSPLLALDLASADAIVKLRLNQVEKMVPVKLDIPSVVAPNQRVQVEVPQMTTANLHERFRWPTDKVLLLSMGVVATPAPNRANPITSAVPMLKSAPRADALLMVECKQIMSPLPTATPAIRSATLPPQSFEGRY